MEADEDVGGTLLDIVPLVFEGFRCPSPSSSDERVLVYEDGMDDTVTSKNPGTSFSLRVGLHTLDGLKHRHSMGILHT